MGAAKGPLTVDVTESGTGGRTGHPAAACPTELLAPAAGDHTELLEQQLLRAQELIEATVHLHRRRSDGASALARTEAAPVGEVLEQLISRARHTMCVTLTGSGEFAKLALHLLPRVPAGVTVRVLCAAETADALSESPTPPCGVQLEVRVSDQALCECLVADGASALVRHAEEGGDHTTLVSDAAAVRAVELLFAGAWSRGRRLKDHLQVHKRLRTDLARKILKRLSEGKTDDVAARELGISLRTYRRYVADFLHEFEVESRFQAGVRAVELGLISMPSMPSEPSEPGAEARDSEARRGR